MSPGAQYEYEYTVSIYTSTSTCASSKIYWPDRSPTYVSYYSAWACALFMYRCCTLGACSAFALRRDARHNRGSAVLHLRKPHNYQQLCRESPYSPRHGPQVPFASVPCTGNKWGFVATVHPGTSLAFASDRCSSITVSKLL